MVLGMGALFVIPDQSWSQLQPSRKSKTTARSSDYKSGYNLRNRRPRNYDQYYYSARTGYELSPYLMVPQAAPRPVVPVEPYSDLEYGSLMVTSLKAHPVAASSTRSEEGKSILETPADQAGFIRAGVAGVLDRAVLMLHNGEQVRLRGIRALSGNGRDDNTRLFAREASRRLQELTAGKDVFLLLDEPVRDRDGLILVTAFLEDGTELNRLMLQEGLAQLQEEDFAAEVNYDPLREAEQSARARKAGLWSRF